MLDGNENTDNKGGGSGNNHIRDAGQVVAVDEPVEQEGRYKRVGTVENRARYAAERDDF